MAFLPRSRLCNPPERTLIEPLESAGSGPKALKTLRASDPATGEQRWYDIEVRRALGFDSFLPGNTNALDGVIDSLDA